MMSRYPLSLLLLLLSLGLASSAAAQQEPAPGQESRELPRRPEKKKKKKVKRKAKKSSYGKKAAPEAWLDGRRIKTSEPFYFEVGKASLKPRSVLLIKQVASVLARHPKIKRLRVEVHTDSRGSSGFNRKNSQLRADAIRKALITEGASAKIRAKGYGEDRPIETNRTAAGRAANRRVELHVEFAP